MTSTEKKKTMDYTEVEAVLKGSEGKIFRVEFYKRTTDELRVMVARIGVKKNLTGEGQKFNPAERGLMTVWDMQKQAYRMINLDTVVSLKLAGEEYEVL